MPSAGFLGTIFSRSSKLYVQRHNPFVYFKSVALDPNRLAKLKPFILDDLEVELRDPGSASRFIYIVPNQCNNQHGTVGCEPMAARFAGGDDFLAQTVPAIINSPAFTNRSVLFVTWDNSYGAGGVLWRKEWRRPHTPYCCHQESDVCKGDDA